jgi:hypothetical protein
MLTEQRQRFSSKSPITGICLNTGTPGCFLSAILASGALQRWLSTWPVPPIAPLFVSRLEVHEPVVAYRMGLVGALIAILSLSMQSATAERLGAAEWPALRLDFSLQRSSMKAHGQSDFSVFATPVRPGRSDLPGRTQGELQLPTRRFRQTKSSTTSPQRSQKARSSSITRSSTGSPTPPAALSAVLRPP